MTVQLLTAAALLILIATIGAVLVLSWQGVGYLRGKRDQNRLLTGVSLVLVLVYVVLVAISRIGDAAR